MTAAIDNAPIKFNGENHRKILCEYIAKGLKPTAIANELEKNGIFVSRRTVSRRIDEFFGSFLEARQESIQLYNNLYILYLIFPEFLQ